MGLDGIARKRSPDGGSIVMTSAPKSASTVVASPPAGPELKSTTRMPLSAPCSVMALNLVSVRSPNGSGERRGTLVGVDGVASVRLAG